MNTAREMKKQKTKKSNKAIRLFARIMGYLALIPAAIFSLTIACDIAISNSTSERIFDDIKDVPKYSTCVVLGTTPYSKETKRGNPYFNNRMDAVAELYRRGGIKQIIVSGDSSRNYDETAKMSSALKKRGVPGKIIVRDTKGQNTLKSIKNVKEGFKTDEFIVVSQQFQNERAIFIANHYRMNAVGYNARDINIKSGYRTFFREKLSRIKVFFDLFKE